ncbi:hypothetical protein SDC9_174166 [bioreactor metagenome]|uniref:Uncharacterized protein n=1 Tax=bioreactor metagenome TaxID=1076179 RepID=A0A645GID9_9ZZZZ
MLRDAPEGTDVGVAYGGGGDHQARAGQNARFGRADHSLVVGTEGIGNALLFGGFQKAFLGVSARQVGRKSFRAQGMRSHGVQRFAGSEYIDQRAVLGVFQRAQYGFHADPRQVLLGRQLAFVRSAL